MPVGHLGQQPRTAPFVGEDVNLVEVIFTRYVSVYFEVDKMAFAIFSGNYQTYSGQGFGFNSG
jgi:hypothetical protein